MHHKKYINNRVVTAAAVVVIALVGFLVFRHLHRSTTPQTPQAPYTSVNLSPATEQEKQDSYEHKEASVQPNPTPPSNGEKQSVTPTIVDASQYDNAIEVRAFVSSIHENGGVCSFVFTNGLEKVSKTSSGIADATTTRCANISISRSEFSKSGDWSLVVSYNSNSYSGSTVSKIVKIQ